MKITPKRIGAVIQARMDSNRLPGKVLMVIGRKPVLSHCVERLKQCKQLDAIVIATSKNKSDDPIARFARSHHIACFRGSLTNVLERTIQAADAQALDVVVRVCADSPFIDPSLVDKFVTLFLKGGYDYLSCLDTAVPHGLENEVVSLDALKKSLSCAKSDDDHEHVTRYILMHRNKFKVRLVAVKGFKKFISQYFTLDTPEDLEFLRAMHACAEKGNRLATTKQLYAALTRFPRLRTINAYRALRKSLRSQ
ncbi:MAG: glycosyltransferase family protein [Candidatus Omnitrophica bacterium]|nr:glycosyltransferase family protein [Candidatus Omnitrophota bacterium]